jgi:hypothetical protein
LIFSAGLVDLPFVTDPYIYVLAVALIVGLAAILQPTSNVVNIDWGKGGARNACFVVAALLALIGAAGEKGWLRSEQPSKDQPIEQTAQIEGPCTSEKLDPQGYYNIGKAWNDLGKYDRAIAFFTCGESAIAEMSSERREAGRETHGFLILDWGNALRGRALTSQRRDDWCAAKDRFQKAQTIFLPIRNKPEVSSTLHAIETYLAEVRNECP